MQAVSTNQIADILHFNDNQELLHDWDMLSYNIGNYLVKR